MKLRLLLFLLTIMGSACDRFPQDPEKTLEKVQGHVLLVGYSDNPPWVVETDSVPTGIEADLVKEFAQSLNARVQWKEDTEQNLFEALEKKELHLVMAGMTDSSPWKKKVAFTRPYFKNGKKKHVLAAVKGENAFLVQLEKFLYAREQSIQKRMQP